MRSYCEGMQVDRNMNQNKRSDQWFQAWPRFLCSPSLAGFMRVPALSWSNLECWILWREENRRIRRKTLEARTRTNNKLNPHMALVWNRTRATDSFNLVLISLSLRNKLTNLSATSVHEALHIHANRACALVKNCKLRLMVEETSHLIQCNKNSINQLYSSSWVKVSQTSYKKVKNRSHLLKV